MNEVEKLAKMARYWLIFKIICSVLGFLIVILAAGLSSL